MIYGTYNEAGELTGVYEQDLHPDHAASYVELAVDQRLDWVNLAVELQRHVDDLGNEYTLPVVVPRPTPAFDLAGEKLKLNQAINHWREAKNFTSFPHQGKLVACDVLSRSDIDGVAGHIALFGTFPPDFPGGWKAVDNTIIPMLALDDFKAMYTSMTAQGTANFNQSQALKAQKDAATDAAGIAAVYAAMEAT